MRNLVSSFVLSSLAARASSTDAPPYRTGIDPARAATSLSPAETLAVCERTADALGADLDRIAPLTCLSFAAFATDESACRSEYASCMTRFAGTFTASCTTGDRVAPAENPICSGVTIAQIDAGMDGYLRASTTTTVDVLCPMPLASRMDFGDLSHFGLSESALAGYNCAVNTAMNPVWRCDGVPCVTLSP